MRPIKQTTLAIILSVLLVTSILTPVSASFSDSVETRSDVPYVDPPDEEDNSSEERQPNENRGNGNGPPDDSDDRNGPPDDSDDRNGPPDDSDDRNGPPDDSDDGNGPPESNGGNGPTEDDEGNGPPDESDQGNDPSDESSGENGLADGSSEGNGPPEDTRSNGPPANDDDGNNADPPSNDNDSNSSNGAQNQNNSVSDENRTVVPTNGSALALRISAYQALDEADFQGNGDRGGRLISELNSTFEYHLDDSRINSAAVFRSDSRIVAGSNAHAPNVSSYLVDSDREIASTSISDTEHVVETLQERNVSFNESAVEYHLEQAHSAYEQGERLRDRSSPGAVQHYRQAWTHSQRALDYLDEAVEPNVTITHRTDLPHNESINYSVEGTVFDVRSDELTTTLTVDNETRTLDLQSDTRPGTVARFNTTVELDRQMPGSANRTYTITVSAEDPGVDIADQGYDETDQVDIHDPQSGADQLRLDGDGLPDTYEEQVTETDPLDPDSNSSRTAENESANRIIDGIEDFDDDRLNTYIEYTERLDPLDPDTDDDNLTDGLEYQYQQIDPADSDTDDDGVLDGREDPDDDGLVNEDEEEAMTGLFLNDSDRDGLEDGPEVHRYGTDPTEPDTDNDGLTDYEEVELGTDPLVADSDSDGTADGNETYQSTTGHSEIGVSVDYQGQGLASERVQIESAPEYQNNPARASSRVRIENDSDFTSATISIQINSSVARSDYDELAIYAWNGSGDDVWQPIRGEIDEENGTITTTVSSFGYYTVLNQTDWEEHTTAEPSPAVDLESNTTVECTGECSVNGTVITVGSSEGEGVNTQNTSNQVNSFSSTFEGSTGGIGILCTIGPDGSCDEDGDGIPNEDDLCPNDPAPDSDDGCPTDDGDGSDDGDDSDDSDGDDSDDSDGDDSEVDGVDTNQADITTEIDRTYGYVSLGVNYEITGSSPPSRETDVSITIDTVEDTSELEPLTVGLDLDDQEGFEEIDITRFEDETVNINITTVGSVEAGTEFRVRYDSDRDGLYNHLEDEAWYMQSTGNRFSTDSETADTDGDGLLDGEEVTVEEPDVDLEASPGRYRAERETEEEMSNPAKLRSDNVGLTDSQELEYDSDPRYPEQLRIITRFPTVAEPNGERGYEPVEEYTDGRTHYEMPIIDEYTPGCDNLAGGEEPDWISVHDHISGEDRSDAFLRVPVEISVSGENVNWGAYDTFDETPIDHLEFSLPNSSSAEIVEVAPTNFEHHDGSVTEFERGTREVYLIIQVEDEITGCIDPTSIESENLGDIQINVRLDRESPLSRHDRGISLSSQTTPYEYNYNYGDQADDLTEIGFSTLRDGLDSYSRVAFVGGTATGVGRLVVYQGGTEAFAFYVYQMNDELASEARDVSAESLSESPEYEAELYNSEESGTAGRDPYILAGTVITIQN